MVTLAASRLVRNSLKPCCYTEEFEFRSVQFECSGECGNYRLSLNRLVSNPQLSVAHEYPLKNFKSHKLTFRWPMRFQNDFNIP